MLATQSQQYDKLGDYSHTKNPLTTTSSKGGAYLHDVFVKCVITRYRVKMPKQKPSISIFLFERLVILVLERQRVKMR